jgi:16S rRNA (guanine527-N7)-methyltransferase
LRRREEPNREPDRATLCALNTALLRRVGDKLGLAEPLDERAVSRFERLAAELVVANARMNLTRLTRPDEIAIGHVLDSLVALKVLDELAPRARVIDVGSGAGFPGLALAIARPTWRVSLLDARAKVVGWLAHAAEALALPHVRTVHARAEDAGQDKTHRATYDVAVARAVASLPTLLELTLPLVREGGLVVAWKGETVDEEVAAAADALSVLGGRVRRRFHYQLPGLEHERVLLVVEKRRKTPKAYPRKAGTPKRKPL